MDAASHVDQLVEGFTLINRPEEDDEKKVFKFKLKTKKLPQTDG